MVACLHMVTVHGNDALTAVFRQLNHGCGRIRDEHHVECKGVNARDPAHEYPGFVVEVVAEIGSGYREMQHIADVAGLRCCLDRGEG